jgi:hypothetical protein
MKINQALFLTLIQKIKQIIIKKEVRFAVDYFLLELNKKNCLVLKIISIKKV